MRARPFAAIAWLAACCARRGAAGEAGAVREREVAVPAPISVSASQSFDGNDGPWSSFIVRVGTPAQDLKVLISTASSETWVIIEAGCPASVPSCPSSRGGIFNPNASSTWHYKNTYYLLIEENLGIDRGGEFGNETIGLGLQGTNGPTLDTQILGGIAAQEYWLGEFGVNPKPINFTTLDEGQASFISTLKEKNMIPSLSFGYTAGNPYKLKSVVASLTLGGYDQGRFEPNNVTFTFAPDNSRDLVVGIQSISTDGGKVKSLLPSGGILSYIDSTVPQIWLPEAACALFEQAFGLVYDPVNKIYPVSDSLHTNLTALNPNITFTLGNVQEGGDTIDIVLSYQAFDLQASWPFYPNSTRYFPIQRAVNETQYTLGRTFLQESYLTVDWERQNFSVSQCIFPYNLSEDIVAISPPSNASSTTPLASSPSPSSNTETIGLAVGLSVGILLILLAIAAFILRRRRRQRQNRIPTPVEKSNPSADPSTDPGAASGYDKAELPTANEVFEIGSSDQPTTYQELHTPTFPPFHRQTELDGAGLSPRELPDVGRSVALGIDMYPRELDGEEVARSELRGSEPVTRTHSFTAGPDVLRGTGRHGRGPVESWLGDADAGGLSPVWANRSAVGVGGSSTSPSLGGVVSPLISGAETEEGGGYFQRRSWGGGGAGMDSEEEAIGQAM